MFIFTLVLCLAALAWAYRHWLKVLRRLKFVALAICTLFAWQTPGIQVIPALQAFSPTYDGLMLALPPLLRLMSVAAVVALLKEQLNPDAWVGSLYALSWPFKYLGLAREKLAIRLRLVLDYVEENDLDWRGLLHSASGSSEEAVIVQCEIYPMSSVDRIWVAGFLLMIIGVGMW
ncbi:hypothetical protein [Uliginosibacterium gangwonense]|uniref:hypothetical protein n=1 Tax=Uliginosibacterium gangwonense TaxID=392736 RepID=UPI0012F76CF4|nr:hypothetical protein [Uliginosibacterium gangwonense]